MAIKIEGSSGLRGSAVKRPGRASEGGAGKFSRIMAEESAGPSSVATANPVYAVDGLLTVQEVDDATARASRGKKRGQDLLDGLDDIRHGLLIGEIPRDKLISLAKMVQSRRVNANDPRLIEILDEIDLRAQVELAKYTS